MGSPIISNNNAENQIINENKNSFNQEGNFNMEKNLSEALAISIIEKIYQNKDLRQENRMDNNNKSECDEGEEDDDEEEADTNSKDMKISNAQTEKCTDAMAIETQNPFSASHVTLEALENTKVAVAQFATSICDSTSDNAMKELAVLQSKLFSLQHQQVLQLQLIQRLQSQITMNKLENNNKDKQRIESNDSDESSNKEEIEFKIRVKNDLLESSKSVTNSQIDIPKTNNLDEKYENSVLNLTLNR